MLLTIGNVQQRLTEVVIWPLGSESFNKFSSIKNDMSLSVNFGLE
jgi:hypothetical protein